jgi:hypothetical protein
VELLLFLGPPVLIAIGLVAIGVRTLRAAGLPLDASVAWSIGAGVSAAIAYVVFGFDLLVYGLAEGGPQYTDDSPYIEYHEALRDDGDAIAVGCCYALFAGVIALVAGAVTHKRPGPLAVLAVLAALAAIALPGLVSSMLPRTELAALPVVGLEVLLPRAADGAEPVVRDVVERGSGRDAAIGVALRGVVDEPAGRAHPELCGDGLVHGARKGSVRLPLCGSTGRIPGRSSTRVR